MSYKVVQKSAKGINPTFEGDKNIPLENNTTYAVKVSIVNFKEENFGKYKMYAMNNKGDKQYLKTVKILEENKDLLLVITPYADFDSIMLEKDSKFVVDYRAVPLGKMETGDNNIIGKDETCVKIGIRANSGSIICLNGQEVIIGKNGIFELRNENIIIKSLYLITEGNYIIDQMNEI